MGARAFEPLATIGLGAVVLALVGAASGCSGGIPGLSEAAPDAGEVLTSLGPTSSDDKSLIYNLVGRWYPEEEITRLSDRTLTPERWCEREPTMVFIVPDKVTVSCDAGPPFQAMIAESKREKDGGIRLTMRAKEDSPLTVLRFQVNGPKATISGSPCFPGKTVPYARFPEYEILSREILGGRRCAQVLPQAVEP